jgi:hypothetical protein
VLLIRRIRELLYEQGFTINGARNRLDSHGGGARGGPAEIEEVDEPVVARPSATVDVDQLRKELLHVIDLLSR